MTTRTARDARHDAWRFGRHTVEVTHLDKVFWPDSGLTKGDLLGYYRAVAPLLLPYLRDRPFIMRAWPDGIEGESFYRWRLPAYAPDWLGRFRYRVHSTRRIAEMAVVGDAAALIWLVNQGVIEMHPWLATTRHPDQPTWMLLDLDPGRGVAFGQILHVAEVIGKALEALGLAGMPKTTGKRGVHLFVAIERRHTFDEVRAWLKGFLTRLAASRPNVLTLDKRLAERGGKVLVDYSQNAAGKSIAAPYGVRALPGAPVSTPLTWREVAAGRVRPGDFTVRTVPDRLRRHGDLFAPLLRRPHRLRPLG